MTKFTLGKVLDQIQYRLGQQKDSAGWQSQRPVIQGMLQTTVALLDEEFKDRLRFVPNVFLEPAAVGSYEEGGSISAYAVPEDCDPHKIDTLSVKWSGVWHIVPKGISQLMRDSAWNPTSTYCAWDIIECGQIEVWPHPTHPHQVRVSYSRAPIEYTDEEECVDMDPQLLIMLTLDTAIPFYGRPDYEVNNRHLNRYLGNIKAKQVSGLHHNKLGCGPRPGTPDHADIIYSHPVYD